jgi:hypothetical protein
VGLCKNQCSSDECSRGAQTASRERPHTKRQLADLMKQARAAGLVVANQNLVDLDFRARSNADPCCMERPRADAERHHRNARAQRPPSRPQNRRAQNF